MIFRNILFLLILFQVFFLPEGYSRFVTPDPLFLKRPQRCIQSPEECNLSRSLTKSNIEKRILEAGNGARRIVFGTRGTDTGHVFNVVNQKGVIRFLDGQKGREALFENFTSLHLLKTN